MRAAVYGGGVGFLCAWLVMAESLVGGEAWKVSLHGGHSGEFCDHAEGTLESILEAAVERGFSVFGVTEHAPRYEERFLYPEEVRLGWDVGRLTQNFDAYAVEVFRLAEVFSDRLHVLRGFECEVVATAHYVDQMLGLREKHRFDYCVGSVHHVFELQIDGALDQLDAAVKQAGSLEKLAVAYYETVATMVDALKPEVVGHLDLICRHAQTTRFEDWASVRDAAGHALDRVAANGGILDLNTAGYRKGLGRPYPAPWLIEAAQARGIGFCFGDDSHRTSDVGAGFDEGRRYLLANGVHSITTLRRSADGLQRVVVPLPLEMPG